MGKELSAVLWALLAAVLALLSADASLRGSWFEDGALPILASSFISVAIMLAIVSVAPRMRLSLQLLAIYLGIYLLLPGFNHASINRFPFFNFAYPESIRTSAAQVVGLFVAAVPLAYVIAARSTSAIAAPPSYTMRTNPILAAALTLVSIASLVVFVSAVGLSGAFATRSVVDQTGLDIAETGLLTVLPRALVYLPIIYATMMIRYSSNRTFGWWLLAINLPILPIVNYPLAIPRSQVFGGILLFSLLIFDFKRPSTRIVLSIAYVFGALVAMPVLEHFTRLGGSFSDLDPQRIASSYFGTGDFDGFQSVNNAIVYVDRYGIEYGWQMLSALLFFVPRAIWTSKAQPTGSITAESAGYTFTNVSQPLPSEFFVDFGWGGVIGGGLLVGFLFYRFDRWIDRGWAVDMRTRLAAGWLMGFGLPIFRGALLGVLPTFVVLAGGLWTVARWGTWRKGIDGQSVLSGVGSQPAR